EGWWIVSARAGKRSRHASANCVASGSTTVVLVPINPAAFAGLTNAFTKSKARLGSNAVVRQPLMNTSGRGLVQRTRYARRLSLVIPGSVARSDTQEGHLFE